MSDRDDQFVDLYRDGRVRDQLVCYHARVAEYEQAHSQVVTISAPLAALAGVAGTLAAADAFGQRPLWAALGVAFPALATAFPRLRRPVRLPAPGEVVPGRRRAARPCPRR
jgi:hypothetical protein